MIMAYTICLEEGIYDVTKIVPFVIRAENILVVLSPLNKRSLLHRLKIHVHPRQLFADTHNVKVFA